MKKIIAFWNTSPWDEKYYQGQLIGTVTIDGDSMEASHSDSDDDFLTYLMRGETAESFLEIYSKYASISGTGSRLMKEDEEPKDLVYDKYVVQRAVPAGGIETVKSYTIDEEGVWHKDAKES